MNLDPTTVLFSSRSSTEQVRVTGKLVVALIRLGVMAETHCFVADDHSYLWMFSKEEMGD